MKPALSVVILALLFPSFGNALVDNGLLSLITSDGKRPGRCTYHRVFRLPGVDCSRKELQQIPATLDSDTEVMDASYNRIRELRSDTFAPYSRMKYLYLGDNMIQTIEAGAFDTMPNLEALDLSINSIFTVPMQIFQLPSLKNLYLQHNNLRTLRQDLKDLQKPIRAPLQRINLAYCRLQLLPDLGILPDLTEFNISGNPLLSLLPVDIAPSCSLKSLDMTEINVDYCSCLLLEKWFNNHVPNVLHSKDDLCTAPPRGYTYCAEDIKLNETNVLYDTCQEMILHRKLEYNAKMIWIIVASTIAAVLLTLGCVLYALHKRNSRKRHRTLKTNQLNNGNLEALLNK